MFIRIFNKVECFGGNKKWLLNDLHDSNSCLFKINKVKNQIYIDRLIKKFTDLGYIE